MDALATEPEALRFAAAIIAAVLFGGLLGWFVGRETKVAPLAYETEEGYGPVDLATKLREAEKRGYGKGRHAAFQQMAQHRGRHLKVVRDDELPEHAESRGPIPHRGAS